MPPEPASWQPDPTGRHEYRYWDGASWTANVSDRGAQSQDPLAAQPAPPGSGRVGQRTQTLPPISAGQFPSAGQVPTGGPAPSGGYVQPGGFPAPGAPSAPGAPGYGSASSPPVPSYLGGASAYSPPLPPGAPGVGTPPAKKGKGLAAGIVIALVAAAVVVGAIVFVGGGDDGGGAQEPGTFEGEITRDEPIAIFEVDIPLGTFYRASLRPEDDFDAVLGIAVAPEISDVPAIEDDFSDFNSEFYSGNDIDEPEALTDLLFTLSSDDQGDGGNEQAFDLAAVGGSYRFVVRGEDGSRGRFELVVEVEDPPAGRITEDDFSDPDFFSDDQFTDDDFSDFVDDFVFDDRFFSADFEGSSDSSNSDSDSDSGDSSSDSSDFSDFSGDSGFSGGFSAGS
jgi:Protein of unknown function (DUF2510)